MINGLTALRQGRGRFGANDLSGAQCVMEHKGRTLIGTVVSQKTEPAPGGSYTVRLDVKHMDGEPWPIRPSVSLVKILEREHEKIVNGEILETI